MQQGVSQVRQSLIAALVVCVMAIGQAANAGTTEIYLSFSAFGEGGAVGNTVNSDLMIGDTGSMYIYVDDGYSIDTGAFLDVFNDNTGTAIFTGAEVFNPTIDVIPGDITINRRWQNSGAPNYDSDPVAVNEGTVTDGFIDEMKAFTVNQGTGLLPAQAVGAGIVDTGWDSTSGAFLFARIDFEIVGSGTSNFALGIGDGLIVDDGISLNPNFGGAQINVTGTIIPEPTTAGLLALGLCGLVARRRR